MPKMTYSDSWISNPVEEKSFHIVSIINKFRLFNSKTSNLKTLDFSLVCPANCLSLPLFGISSTGGPRYPRSFYLQIRFSTNVKLF